MPRTKKKVFIAIDKFIYVSPYLVLARDEEHAGDAAHNLDPIHYLGTECDEFLRTEIQEEVATILIVKTSTLGQRRPYRVRLVPANLSSPNPVAFLGYRVLSDRIDPAKRVYSKLAWQQVEEGQQEGNNA
jgi:hypothetical protein